jgi:hypothetical protein
MARVIFQREDFLEINQSETRIASMEGFVLSFLKAK